MMAPAYPPDWSSRWNELQRKARTAYTAAQSRVRFAAVRAAGILVGGGGSLQVAGRREQDRMLHVGSDDEGGGARLWLGRPRDGSAVLDLRAAEGEAGQWALRDQVGNAVVAEGPEGVGLARPVMPVATQWIASSAQFWPSTSSQSWQRMMLAWAVFQHTAVTFYFKAFGLSGRGKIRFRVDGTVVGERDIPRTVGMENAVTERFVIDGTPYLGRNGPVLVELEGRCLSGDMALNATPFYNEGGGRAPEPPQGVV
ncbi:hypothetical protein HNR23_003774 [Nocardiopsis mwathae]|uniref:Uncharacterized protein n=2 Tax=Nocardiopsis mwathae TaxID=1472723 RepID=A0A7W9YKJ5_9ACTN|nr:hypothetical protein [Nocardiopsis mwathae]